MKVNDKRMRKVLANQALYNLGAEDVNPNLYELAITHAIFNGTEYLRVQEEGPVKAREDAYYSGEAEESDEEFKWVPKLKEKNQSLLDNQTYFTIINASRKAFTKGSQAWYCYGARTN